MTFINSIINDLDDINIQFNNETKYWNTLNHNNTTLEYLKYFNNRHCRCCNCDLYDHYNHDAYDTYYKKCGKIGDIHMCYGKYLDSIDGELESDDEYCQCECIYPPIPDGQQLSYDDKIKILTYIRDNGVLFTNYLLDFEEINITKQNNNNNVNKVDTDNIDLSMSSFSNPLYDNDKYDYKLRDTEWNNMVKEVFNISDDYINKCIEELIEKSKQKPSRLNIFAKNYNILRIMSGLGDLNFKS